MPLLCRADTYIRARPRPCQPVAAPLPVCPAPAALLLPLPQKSNNVLLTASGTAKLADCAFSRDLKNTFLSELPLVGTFAW